MDLVSRAIWAIERRLVGEVTLESIASACGASPSHLSHLFSAATGQSIVAYARARRLSLAAEALAKGGDDILAVALDAGYASHEAFTRAFRAAWAAGPRIACARNCGCSISTLPRRWPWAGSCTAATRQIRIRRRIW